MENLFAGLISFFGFNTNPMKPAQDDIHFFQTHHRQEIRTYRSLHRTLGYASQGDPTKRAVIFVHGSPGSKDSWFSFFLKPSLAATFHLLAVDRPGYGESGSESEPSLQKQAEDIWELMKLNSSKEKPILVGHSYGGPVIAKIAMLYPDEVGAVVFVASSVDPNLEETKFIQRLGNLWGVRSLIPHDLRVCNEEILALKEELILMLPDWSKLKAHVAVIHGDMDDLVSAQNVEFISSRIKIDDLQILQGMNHFIPWHRPLTIEEAIFKMDSL